MKILLVEDHAFLRESIALTLSEVAEGAEIVQAAHCAEALNVLRKSKRFVLVMLDLALPGQDGLGCMQNIRQLMPSVPVLVVSAYDDAQTIQRVRAGGAAGFVPKRLSGDALRNAVRHVLGGGAYWPEAHQTVETTQPPSHKPKPKGRGISARSYGLTARQMRVLQLLLAGQSNREIAQQLSVCEGTVKVHLNNIFKILGVKSRAQAIVAVSDFGIRFES